MSAEHDEQTPPDDERRTSDDEMPSTKRSMARRALRLAIELALAVGVIVVGLDLLSDLLDREPRARRGGGKRVATLVTVETATPDVQPVTLHATGMIQPARRVAIRPQVSGLVREMGARLDPGAFVAAGERLIELDDRDYRFAVQRAQANLDQALAELALEEGNQNVARADRAAFDDIIVDEDLVLRKPQLALVEARINAARAQLAQARLDRTRVRIEAPFDAIIEDRAVDFGASVQPNTTLFTLVGAERWWVEAQLPADELRWIHPRTDTTPGSSADITMPAVWGSEMRAGEVVQIRPGLETEGRLARVIIEIRDPLARLEENRGKPRLLLDSWVEITLHGESLQGVYAISRAHLRDGDNVWIMTPENALEIRPVSVAFRGDSNVLVDGGITSGDTLVTSPLAAPVVGMSLRTKDMEPERGEGKGKGGGGRP